MAKIIAPNKEYSGLSAGVLFCNGTGSTDDPILIKWFEDHGYQIEEKKPDKKASKKAGE